jgi:hypothetical protein
MRLFIAREALDPHLKIGAPLLNSQLPIVGRVKSAIEAARFYGKWYPRQWLPIFGGDNADRFHLVLEGHLHFAANSSRRLARRLFHAMGVHGPKLEREQILLGRFVDIGTEIFAIATTCSRAQSMLGAENIDVLAVADYFCRLARLRINGLFHSIKSNADRPGYRLAQRVLSGQFNWLENGIL